MLFPSVFCVSPILIYKLFLFARVDAGGRKLYWLCKTVNELSQYN